MRTASAAARPFAERDDRASAYAANARLIPGASATPTPRSLAGADGGHLRATLERVAAGYGGSADHRRRYGAGIERRQTAARMHRRGADYRFSPDTWRLCASPAGLPVQRRVVAAPGAPTCSRPAHLSGTHWAAYISAALAYGWQDITTDRP